MAGSVVRIGRYRTSSGPDLAVVYSNQQLASFTSPASHSSKLILYRGGAWIGRYSGNPRARLGLLRRAPDSNSPGGYRPGGVAAYTGEMVPSETYTGGGGGQLMTANLTTPFLTTANEIYTIAITNSTGVLGTSMFQAADISETNEWFYRKSISGNVPQDASGSATSNEGQLVGWFEGEVNVAPNTPTGLSPSGSNLLISRTPTLTANFSDANETLNNGVAWDRLSRTEVEIRTGSTSGPIVWSSAWNNSSAEQTNRKSSVTVGVNLSYGTTYYYRVRHRDRAGDWSSWASTTFSIQSPNDPPHAPDQLSPSGAITGSLTPTISFRHRDPNGDPAQQANVQVQRVSDSVLIWNLTFNTSAAHNGTVSRTYSGSSLAYNTNYRFRARTRDNQGAWGAWSGWTTFQVTSLASVDTPSSPSGYQASQTPANIVARYTHNSGLNSQAFRVRLLSSSGSVIATSSWINKTVSSGNDVTITWAEAGFDALAWGFNGQVQVLARDANGVEALSWSNARAFHINSAPTTPSGLNPNGSPHGSRPLLVVTNVSDADQPKSALTVKAILNTSAGSFTRTMTWAPDRNRWEYQTTSADLPSQSSFVNTWQAYSYDGIVYSGGTTVEADAAKSGIATFVYDAVPVVEITGPASPIETSQPTITWTSTQTQVSYHLRMYNDSDVLVYDSGVVNTSTTEHVVSPTKFLGGEVWNTGETFFVSVSSTSVSSLTGTSELFGILLEFTPPASLPLTGEGIALPQTTQVNAILLDHDQTTIGSENFEGYDWYRWELDSEGNILPETEVHLKRQMNDAITTLLDAEIESGKVYRWGVVVRERRENDIVVSEIETFDGSVRWDGVVIHAPSDPANTAVELMWSESDGVFDPTYTWARSTEQFETVRGDRVFSIGKKRHTDAHGTFGILDDEAATAEQRLASLDRLFRLQGGEIDGEPHIVCWRTGRGGVNAIVYGVLESEVPITYEDSGYYAIDLGIREASHTLGFVEDEE